MNKGSEHGRVQHIVGEGRVLLRTGHGTITAPSLHHRRTITAPSQVLGDPRHHPQILDQRNRGLRAAFIEHAYARFPSPRGDDRLSCPPFVDRCYLFIER